MTTEERLENLERELAEARALAARANRTGGLLALALLLVAGAGLAWAMFAKAAPATQVADPAAPAKVIRANQFILEDEKGKTRADLSMSKYGAAAMLRVFDENDKPRAALMVSNDGPSLILNGTSGKGGFHVMVPPDDRPMVNLSDENGKLRWSAP